jgi:alkaline phosphatase D
MPPVEVPVAWQIARDRQMRRVVQRGTVMASPTLAHSVHVEVKGLEPAQTYWYQFQAGGEASRVGRTRTAPATQEQISRLAFAFASCQDWQNGLYVAHKHLAEEELDFVVFLGDYIYEGAANPQAFRQHQGGDCLTLTDYRNRYAQYKSDPHLQAAHAAFPWIVTWDDHEVDNNYANLSSEDGQDIQSFAQRRAAAYQAYYEHLPLRLASLPQAASMQLYRRFSFGNLATFNILDTRQYRSDQPCGDGTKPRCEGALDEAQTMMGAQQEQWLQQGLTESAALWNVIAQQVMLAQYNISPRPEVGVFNLDQWDGYVAARRRLLAFLQQRQPANPVVITGDLHSSWVNDLKLDFDNPASPTLGAEFVGTSISSNFPSRYAAAVSLVRAANPQTKFFEGTKHGYVRCHLTPKFWQTDYRVVSSLTEPDASISTLASFVVETGQPGAQRNS